MNKSTGSHRFILDQPSADSIYWGRLEYSPLSALPTSELVRPSLQGIDVKGATGLPSPTLQFAPFETRHIIPFFYSIPPIFFVIYFMPCDLRFSRLRSFYSRYNYRESKIPEILQYIKRVFYTKITFFFLEKISVNCCRLLKKHSATQMILNNTFHLFIVLVVSSNYGGKAEYHHLHQKRQVPHRWEFSNTLFSLFILPKMHLFSKLFREWVMFTINSERNLTSQLFLGTKKKKLKWFSYGSECEWNGRFPALFRSIFWIKS